MTQKTKHTLMTLAMLCIGACVGSIVLSQVQPAFADSTPNICTTWKPAITDGDLTTAQTFTAARTPSGSAESKSAFGLLLLRVKHDDSANGAVTRIDIVCNEVDVTVEPNDDYEVQSVKMSNGVGTSNDYVIQKAVSGTEDKNFTLRLDWEGFGVPKCTLTAGEGAAHADDRLDVQQRYCVKG